ncbi:hypothetical protein MHL30_20115 [Priestia flexa]|uniref:hypothetical protein n=1 Tax=Priestia flexa TaxID=86664 RepID=UPI001EF60938|nr:hypothetical protein [Priestia flexa]MCG7315394.1 hypothetical protein [Priestia flexa]
MINNKAIRLTCVPTLILALFVAFCFPLQAKGSEGFPAEEELVEELAAQLEFLMEEALVVENGLRTFDFEKIEDEFGKEVRDEIEMLTVGLQPVENTKSRNGNLMVTASNEAWKSCMIGAIKDHFGVAMVTAALEGGLWAYLEKKAYKEAAKLLVKFAVGSNAVGLAGTLIYYGGVCTYKYG